MPSNGWLHGPVLERAGGRDIHIGRKCSMDGRMHDCWQANAAPRLSEARTNEP